MILRPESEHFRFGDFLCREGSQHRQYARATSNGDTTDESLGRSMTSLRAKEGYLLIDHRASPGTRQVPEGKLFETGVYTCPHCQYQVIKNVHRIRERALCMKCMSIVCDGCAALGECRPFLSQYYDKPNTIISAPGAAAHTIPALFLPPYLQRNEE